MARHVVAAVADFPSGTRRLITVNDRAVVVFNVKGPSWRLREHQALTTATTEADRSRR